MKKFCNLFVVILTVLILFEASFVFASSNELPIIPAPTVLVGDADSNGTVNYLDAVLVLRHSVGLETLEDEIIIRCDVDGDGVLGYLDAMQILRYGVGLLDSF